MKRLDHFLGRSCIRGGLDQFLFARREVDVLQRVQHVPYACGRHISSSVFVPQYFVLVPYLWRSRGIRLLAMSKHSGESCARRPNPGEITMPGNMERAALRAAAQAAEQTLANAAEQAERQHPQDPYAQRVAEVGMLTGALRVLLDAVRPFTEEDEEDGQ
ncbi:hypothetical protein [Streptomyces sp. NPDC056628]|uniref:hypothetical protein n=1 Tax=Streptomyces sp. NPDC056628 TaxID=3345882 RepID=UPI00367AE084